MKHRIAALFFLFVVPTLLFASRTDTLSLASLTDSLDAAIKVYDDYVAFREERIASLRQQLQQADTASMEYFRLTGAVYEEYKSYNCDSALHYLHANLAWATCRGLADAVAETRLEQAYLMASAGLYREASEALQAVDRATLPERLLHRWYDTHRHLYNELVTFTQEPGYLRHYREQAALYDDSLMALLPLTAPLYLERSEMRASEAGNYSEALAINDARLASATPNTPRYALVTYERSVHYNKLGNREERKRCLMLSALTDLRLAITDHASLWNLAEILYEEGDIERAYRYIRFSWDEINRYNARSRSLQLAGILSLIDRTYQVMAERQNDSLRLYIWLISALTLLLIAAVAYIYRQMKRLSAVRTGLEHINEQLHISNHIKEEYIGRFMNLCSIYIKRLDSYRRMVNKKISAGQTEELLKLVRSQDVLDSGLKELYEHFDTAFLHLFPDFIEQFNALLQPEERIYPRKGELLNTELRIFALIRLGIDDSSQIAEFLRYSVNTIYNYRARVKNKACVSRDEFEERLMQIR